MPVRTREPLGRAERARSPLPLSGDPVGISQRAMKDHRPRHRRQLTAGQPLVAPLNDMAAGSPNCVGQRIVAVGEDAALQDPRGHQSSHHTIISAPQRYGPMLAVRVEAQKTDSSTLRRVQRDQRRRSREQRSTARRHLGALRVSGPRAAAHVIRTEKCACRRGRTGSRGDSTRGSRQRNL